MNTTESKKLFGTLKQKTKGSFNEASNWLNSQKNKPALNLIKAAFDKKKKRYRLRTRVPREYGLIMMNYVNYGLLRLW